MSRARSIPALGDDGWAEALPPDPFPPAASDKKIPFTTPSELLAKKRPSLLHELIRVRGRLHKQLTRCLHMPRHSGATRAHKARVADGDTTSIDGSGWQRARPADPHNDSHPHG